MMSPLTDETLMQYLGIKNINCGFNPYTNVCNSTVYSVYSRILWKKNTGNCAVPAAKIIGFKPPLASVPVNLGGQVGKTLL